MATSAGAIDLDPSEGPRVLPRIWSIRDLILGVVATTAGTLLLVATVGLVLFLMGDSGGDNRIAGALSAIALESMLGLWVVYRAYRRRLRPADLGFTIPTRWSPLWIAWGGSYAVLLGYALTIELLKRVGIDASRFNQGNTLPLDASEGGLVLLLLGLAVVGLAPLCEELFFRGLIFRGLRGYWTLLPSLLLSGLLFGAFHLNASVVVPFTLIGMLFAWSMEASGGSILPAIAAHGAVNSFSFIVTASGVLQ
ncbi:MAG: CPBP family intramembrane metalloprotease [Dehalococcoidia bacterium]|nr:CPBP family intramembrane metalloprotease [Dehalococcoidia bacterium]